MCIHVDRQRRARGRQPPSFGHNSCGVGGADGGSVAVVVGAIVESTPEPTADRTAVLFGRRERLRRRRPGVVRGFGRRRGDG